MNKSEFEQGRRVRLLVTIDGGEYQAGATGYLNQWFVVDGSDDPDESWGVVFDQDGDEGYTQVQCILDSGRSALLTDLIEPIVPIVDELSEATQRLTAEVYSWDDLVIQHEAAAR